MTKTRRPLDGWDRWQLEGLVLSEVRRVFDRNRVCDCGRQHRPSRADLVRGVRAVLSGLDRSGILADPKDRP